jgi:CRP-like cAMP-binding protein
MEVTEFIFSKVIRKNKLISELQETHEKLLEFILTNVDTSLFMPEDYIIKQEEDGNSLFFLAKGECEVLVKDENKMQNQERILKIGDMFGEIALISNCKRTASVKCLNYNSCAKINYDSFKEMCRLFPFMLYKMKQNRSEYNDKWKIFLRKLGTGVFEIS